MIFSLKIEQLIENDASMQYVTLVINMMIGNKIEKMINSNKKRSTIIEVNNNLITS